jgi:hypothetical protein
MKFKKPVNENYCATVVKIKNVVQLDNCDNIQATIIFGNHIIISKDVKVGDIGVYFPAETQLSHEYANYNNLYRHSELNMDDTKKGYLEDNRRIRTMKLRGNKSMGLFMPLSSLGFAIDMNDLSEGDSFDEIKNIPICNKYVVPVRNSGGANKKKNKVKKISKLIDGQFRFHDDTAQFGKNAHVFKPDDTMSITYKIHGTSVVISKIMCKKKLNLFYRFLKFIGINVVDTEYDNVYASRKTIKNDELNPSKQDYYDVDIWGLANNRIKEYLLDGMTVYAEIVGHLPNGKYIQKSYDYGCDKTDFNVYVYRITYTNPSGNVFEFSAKQVQDWCTERGLKAVPELYYGKVRDIFQAYTYDDGLDLADNLINYLKQVYLEQDCYMCKNKLPAEGIVVRKEANDNQSYKLKSFRFLKRETDLLDKGEEDIEESQQGEE